MWVSVPAAQGRPARDIRVWLVPKGHRVVRVVAIDPGCTHIFTAVDALHGSDGSRGSSSSVIKVHHRQYRSACGFTAFELWLNKLLRRNRDTRNAVSAIPVGRGVGLAAYCAHTRASLDVLLAAKRLYGGKAAQRWALRKHCLQQRQFDRMAQLFSWGFTTVRGRRLVRLPKPPCPPKPFMSVTGLGDASVGHKGIVSRRQGCPAKGFAHFYRRRYSSSRVHFVMVDEFRTSISKVCSRCCTTSPPRA